MKTTKIFTVLTFTLFTAFAVNSFAADPQPGTNTRSANFIDENGDGVCDNYANNGKGLGLGKGERRNFVDADGDGVCDNYANNGRGLGLGRGLRRNFVDADRDGVCDNARNNNRQGNGTGKGRGVNSLKK